MFTLRFREVMSKHLTPSSWGLKVGGVGAERTGLMQGSGSDLNCCSLNSQFVSVCQMMFRVRHVLYVELTVSANSHRSIYGPRMMNPNGFGDPTSTSAALCV